jgi:hypothetical protein
MAVGTFESIFEKAAREGISLKVREAKEWYRREAARSTRDATKLIKEDTDRLQNKFNRYSVGRMYLFYYDAKHKNDKKKLPYWDRFPLIFPIEMYSDGFLGINFHYLPPQQRARLLDALDTLVNNKKFDDTTKLRVSYQILKSASQMRLFKPCVKRYLFTQVRSKYMYVAPNEWPMAIFLPVAKWQNGVTAEQVYKDSMSKVRQL